MTVPVEIQCRKCVKCVQCSKCLNFEPSGEYSVFNFKLLPASL